ncbi:MAG: sulfurtransferase TusA family protein [Gammaproteobacteria bacterium]|jgi:TusA-related sulfurtransferase
MWPFKKQEQKSPIYASTTFADGVAIIDVRGQTCPGYLLAINRAVDDLALGTRAQLLITYPPCGDDVKAWSNERNIQYLGMRQDTDKWVIEIQK